MPVEIDHAHTPADREEVSALFCEYAASLGIDLEYQGFGAEVAGLPGAYVAPGGGLLMARVDGLPAGCVALRARGEGACEMKRLYIRPDFQGRGLGRALAERVIAEARNAGYRILLLDTLPTMARAIRLYESLGFARCAPYFKTPIEGNIFMELRL